MSFDNINLSNDQISRLAQGFGEIVQRGKQLHCKIQMADGTVQQVSLGEAPRGRLTDNQKNAILLVLKNLAVEVSTRGGDLGRLSAAARNSISTLLSNPNQANNVQNAFFNTLHQAVQTHPEGEASLRESTRTAREAGINALSSPPGQQAEPSRGAGSARIESERQQPAAPEESRSSRQEAVSEGERSSRKEAAKARQPQLRTSAPRQQQIQRPNQPTKEDLDKIKIGFESAENTGYTETSWLKAEHINVNFRKIAKRNPNLAMPSSVLPLQDLSKATQHKAIAAFPEVVRDNKRYVAVPLNLSHDPNVGIHWTTLLIDRENRTIEYYDSKGHPIDPRRFTELSKYLNENDPVHPPKPYTFVQVINQEVQRDGYQCGAWATHFLERRLQNPPDVPLDRRNPQRYSQAVARNVIPRGDSSEYIRNYRSDNISSGVREEAERLKREVFAYKRAHHITDDTEAYRRYLLDQSTFDSTLLNSGLSSYEQEKVKLKLFNDQAAGNTFFETIRPHLMEDITENGRHSLKLKPQEERNRFLRGYIS